MHSTRKTVFDHISKHLAVSQKLSAACCIFNSLLGVGNVVKYDPSCLIYYLSCQKILRMLLKKYFLAVCQKRNIQTLRKSSVNIAYVQRQLLKS